MFCRFCGGQLPADSLFCPSCGAKLDISATGKNTVQETRNDIERTIQMGFMSISTGDTARAIALFESAIQNNPNNIGAYLGMICAVTGTGSYPYCEKLKSFSADQIKDYLTRHSAVLKSGNHVLLSQIMYNTKDLEMTKAVLEAGADASSPQAIYYAVAELKDETFVKLLVSYGADVNWEHICMLNDGSSETRSILTEAIWTAKSPCIVEILLKNGADPNYIIKSCTSDGKERETWSILNLCVRFNLIDMARLLLKYGADIKSERRFNANNQFKDNWLSFGLLSDAIVYTKNPAMIKIILDAGASPNYRHKSIFGKTYNPDGWGYRTAISDAIMTGNNDILELVLKAGANPRETYKFVWGGTDDYGKTVEVPVLDIAAHTGNRSAIKILINAGATFSDSCMNDGHTFPLYRRDYEGGIKTREMAEKLKFLRGYGWKGPNFLESGNISYLL